MTYTPRDAILHICRGYGIPLTEMEVATMVADSGENIERMGLTVRAAAQEYERFVCEIAAEMVARRTALLPVHEASMDVTPIDRS